MDGVECPWQTAALMWYGSSETALQGAGKVRERMTTPNDHHLNANELVRALEVEWAAGRMTLEEMRERLKADAERAVDADMLGVFCDAFEERVLSYSAMLQAIAQPARDRGGPDAGRVREAEIDGHVEGMERKLPLWREQVRSLFAFLAELRADSGQGPVRLNEMSHATAHQLAAHAMDLAAQAWQSCREIAHRSRTDPRYRYAASAAELFREAHLGKLPKPNDLMGLLQLERAAALKAVRQSGRPADRPPVRNAVIDAKTVHVSGQSVHVATEGVSWKAAARTAGSTRSVKDVIGQLERYRAAGGPYLDQRTFARFCRCRPSTVNKAIQTDSRLRAWKDAALQARKQRAAPRRDAGDFDIVTEHVPAKAVEPVMAEDVDLLLQKLRRQAASNPAWLDAIDAMAPDDQATLARLYADGDYEQSPLADDPPGPPRHPKHHGRV